MAKKTIATDGKIITLTAEHLAENIKKLTMQLQSVLQAKAQKEAEINELQARALRLDERIRLYKELTTQLNPAPEETPNGKIDTPPRE